MFYTDGRHSSVYLYEPPMGTEQYCQPIDELLDLGIDTITYAVGDCSVLLYETRAGERWGHNVDLTDHLIWYRAGANATQMIESGTDPLKLVCDHAHKRGFQFLPHLLLNMNHTDHGRVTNCRVADFTSSHPEWQVGPEPAFPEAAKDNPGRLSYSHPEVRENRLAIIRELLEDYPTDGIELNLDDYTPLIARSEVNDHTDTLTEFVRQVRAICEQASETQGRKKRLVVRVPATLEGSLSIGLDVPRWIREEIVHTVVAMPVRGGWANETTDLQSVVESTRGTSVKVLAGQDVDDQNTRKTNYAAVSNCYAVGAQGILFATYYPPPNRYPYDFEGAGRLRFLGYPELIENFDKTYRLPPTPARSGIGRFAGLTDQLPMILKPEETGTEIKLEIHDDIAGKADTGQLWACKLNVLINQLLHTDEIRIHWNGLEVPDSAIRWADWTYHLRPKPDMPISGYRAHVDLTQGLLPVRGVNNLRIDLVKRDEKLITDVSVHHVEVEVEYIAHRNALRDDENFLES